MAFACKSLKNAEKVLAIETTSVSTGKVAEESMTIMRSVPITTEAQFCIREEVLKKANLRIDWDKQGKHIVGHRNYIPNRSILECSDPQRLVNEFAGKSYEFNKFLPGMPGYKEIINFEEFIGYVVEKETLKKTATTWGKIHYAKDGVHIVPTMPRR